MIKMINFRNRSAFLLVIMMLIVILSPALVETGLAGLMEDDELPYDVFSVTWIAMPIRQMSVLLMLGISIFALFGVYVGGRSKAKRFNDRTIEYVNSLICIFSRTALFRAVFNFLFIGPYSDHPKNELTNIILLPTLIPCKWRY